MDDKDNAPALIYLQWAGRSADIVARLTEKNARLREALEDAVLAWRSGEKPSDYPHLLDAAAALVKGDE